MDIKNIVSLDNENIWKSDHTSNPYAIVLNASKIWRFTKYEWPDQYKFYADMIQLNAKDFRWGLQKQKSFKLLTIKEYCYFMSPPDIIYRVLRKEDDKKNKRPKKRNR